MIKPELLENAKTVDFFDALTEEEKNEAELLAYIAMEIHKKRLEMKMSQKEFADLAHVSQAQVSKWESGEYNFSVSSLSKVLSVIGMTIKLQEESRAPVLVNHSKETAGWHLKSTGTTSFTKTGIAAAPGIA